MTKNQIIKWYRRHLAETHHVKNMSMKYLKWSDKMTSYNLYLSFLGEAHIKKALMYQSNPFLIWLSIAGRESECQNKKQIHDRKIVIPNSKSKKTLILLQWDFWKMKAIRTFNKRMSCKRYVRNQMSYKTALRNMEIRLQLWHNCNSKKSCILNTSSIRYMIVTSQIT